jgi:hypothetical protein
VRSSEEEFVPREVRKIAKVQAQREAEKLKQIKANRTFADPEIDPLLALLPVAKIKLRQLPPNSKRREDLQLSVLTIKRLLQQMDDNL